MTNIVLEPLSPDYFAAWRAGSRDGFVDQQVAAGVMPGPEAEKYADEQLADLLADGPASPGMHVWSARRGEDTVGHLWIRVLKRTSGLSAYVMDIDVDPAVRRQGLGRATMLAGEHAAREMGAADIALNVFGANAAAIGLYESLGYAVTAQQMAIRLDGDRQDPPSDLRVRLCTMTPDRFGTFRSRQELTYAADLVRAGMLPLPEARAKAADDLGHLLPDGLATPGHLLWTVRAAGVDADHPDQEQEVGLLWAQVSDRSDGRHAYGYRLEVRPELRRRGYAQAVIAEAERYLRDQGVRSVALHVYAFNGFARTLYVQAGFTVTAQQMRKSLSGVRRGAPASVIEPGVSRGRTGG